MTQIFEWFSNNPWATALLMVGFIAVSALMVLAILIQRPQGGGLSAAFGGGAAGSGQTAFGTKTGDALTWFTISVFLAFLLFGIVLNYATVPVVHREAPAVSSSAPAGGDKKPETAPANGTPTDGEKQSAAPAPAPVNAPTPNPVPTPGAAGGPAAVPAAPAPAPSTGAPASPAAPAPSVPRQEPAPPSPTPKPETTPKP